MRLFICNHAFLYTPGKINYFPATYMFLNLLGAFFGLNNDG